MHLDFDFTFLGGFSVHSDQDGVVIIKQILCLISHYKFIFSLSLSLFFFCFFGVLE